MTFLDVFAISESSENDAAVFVFGLPASRSHLLFAGRKEVLVGKD